MGAHTTTNEIALIVLSRFIDVADGGDDVAGERIDVDDGLGDGRWSAGRKSAREHRRRHARLRRR
jgi:hypothetical protein